MSENTWHAEPRVRRLPRWRNSLAIEAWCETCRDYVPVYPGEVRYCGGCGRLFRVAVSVEYTDLGKAAPTDGHDTRRLTGNAERARVE